MCLTINFCCLFVVSLLISHFWLIHFFIYTCFINHIEAFHDDVIKWKHFPRNWPFVRGIHRSRWIPHTKASDAQLVFFDLRLNKRLSKQPWGWWFETPSWSLWRHCNVSSYMCSVTPEPARVGCSHGHMRGPGIGCWLSDRSNCSQWSFEAAVLPINPNIYIDQWQPIVIHHTITLLVVIQLCSPRCWHHDSNYCRTRCRQSQLTFILSPLPLLLRLLVKFQSDIPLFTLTWPAKHSPNQGWESTHRLHLYHLGGVINSP